MTVSSERVIVFNSPFEAGLRSMIILTAVYPASIDLHRVLQFDYMLVHSADLGGPESLHPPVPLRSGELLVRRGLLDRGLQLMMSRGLVDRILGEGGIHYIATDASQPFLSCLTAPYALKLIERAQWVAESFLGIDEQALSSIMKRSFAHWSSEFHSVEQGRRVEL